jgi:hypothetical protein
MKNKLSDLHNHLFAQLERLGNQELKGEALMEEALRAKMICEVSSQIIANGKLVSNVAEIIDGSFCKIKLPEFLGVAAGETENRPRLLKRNA